jgi:hypothetical protein
MDANFADLPEGPVPNKKRERRERKLSCSKWSFLMSFWIQQKDVFWLGDSGVK